MSIDLDDPFNYNRFISAENFFSYIITSILGKDLQLDYNFSSKDIKWRELLFKKIDKENLEDNTLKLGVMDTFLSEVAKYVDRKEIADLYNSILDETYKGDIMQIEKQREEIKYKIDHNIKIDFQAYKFPKLKENWLEILKKAEIESQKILDPYEKPLYELDYHLSNYKELHKNYIEYLDNNETYQKEWKKYRSILFTLEIGRQIKEVYDKVHRLF